MTTIVLVHGAYHGAWCWHRLAPLLAARGHRAVALDLPGREGDDAARAALTLQDYIDHLAGVIERCAGPVVLAGHSLGGVTISQTAEALPQKVEALIYIAAIPLADGQCARDVLAAPPQSPVANARRLSEDGRLASVREDLLVETYYGRCAEDAGSSAVEIATISRT